MNIVERNNHGQAFMAMTFGIAFLVLGVVGLFAFDIGMGLLAREQLKAACQAAAIAGAAAMAGSDDTNTSQMQLAAMQQAMTVFRSNNCIGKSLVGSTQSGSLTPATSPNQCLVYMQLIDPHTDKTVNIGNPKGKILNVSANFGFEPAFSRYVHVPMANLQTTAVAGVPQMDIVLCFDVSASIDDQTPVSFVKRYWNSGKTVYTVVQAASGSPAGAVANGHLFDVIGPAPTGSALNATYPQDCSAADSGNKYPLSFSESDGASGLRGKNDNSPPGNTPGQNPLAPVGGNTTFTDIVVNIDGKNQFAGYTADGYNFPNVGTLVEAARGNLENQTVFTASGADKSLTQITPKAGYQAEYLKLAKQNVQPIADAQSAAATFFTIMNNNTNGHFGLVSFSTQAGAPSGSYNEFNVDQSYSASGKGKFPVPLVQLDPTPAQTNFSNIMDALPTTTAYGSTNIGDSLYTAVQMLKSKSRAGSRKAIVLFTDGQPTQGNPLNGDPWQNAREAAVEAREAGIPIYTIGLAQNAQIIPGETAILNDTNADPQNGGVAAIAGGGGRFFLVTDQKYLRWTFENLARQFVQMTKG